MDSSLHELWLAAGGSPFQPVVDKGSHFFVGFVLLLLGLAATGIFALSISTLALFFSPFAAGNASPPLLTFSRVQSTMLMYTQIVRSPTWLFLGCLPLWPLRT